MKRTDHLKGANIIQLQTIPFDRDVIPFMFFLATFTAIVFPLFIHFIIRTIQKKTNVAVYLTGVVFSWLIGIGFFFSGMISWMVLNDRGPIYKISLPIGYSSMVFSTLFALLFMFELLKVSAKKKKIGLGLYCVYLIILEILIFDERNQWGVLPPIPPFRLICLVLLIVGNVLIYSYLISEVRRLIPLLTDNLYKRSIQFILGFLICTLMFYVLEVVSEVHLMFVPDPPPFGPFEYLAYTSGIIALIMGDIGLLQPEWFKKKFDK